MVKEKKQWKEVPEFCQIASRLVEKYPERFSDIEVDKIVAYACTNHLRPDKDKKPYTIKGAKPPESFTNNKPYCVKFYLNVWEQTEEQKIATVYSALSRIDVSTPGGILPLDYADQEEMVVRFGPNWQEKGNLPNLLKNLD